MLIEEIKNEAKIIKQIVDKDRSLKFYHQIENTSFLLSFILSFIICSIIAYFCFNSNDFIKNLLAFFNIFLFLGFIVGLVKNCILKYVHSKWKRKILGDKTDLINKIFDEKYYIEKSELIKYNNLQKLLSKNSKLILENITILSTESKIEDIEKRIYVEEIIDQPLSDFINYYKNKNKNKFKSDVKEFKVDIKELIKLKINNELKDISKEDFLKNKNNLIYLAEEIEDSAVELNILKRIEKLKLKYDNVVINKEIEKIKKNVQYKKDNKVLRSI